MDGGGLGADVGRAVVSACSVVADGYTKVTRSSIYTPESGFGWLEYVKMHDRGGSDPLTSDFHYATSGTFVADLANGIYDVTLTLGDAGSLRDQVAVTLEGQQVDLVSTARGKFYTATYRVEVTDGQFTLLLQDRGGASSSFAINSLEIQSVDSSLDALFATESDSLLLAV